MVAKDIAFVPTGPASPSPIRDHQARRCVLSSPLSRFALVGAPSPTAAVRSPSLRSLYKVQLSPLLQPAPPRRRPSNPGPGAGPRRVLVWFHSDLRVGDNAALRAGAEAAGGGPGGLVVPFYATHACSCGRSAACFRSAAADLRARLRACGSDLVARAARDCDSLSEVILAVCRDLGLEAVYLNWGHLFAHVECQVAVAKRLRQAGLRVEGFWSATLVKPAPADPDASVAALGRRVRQRRDALEPLPAVDTLPPVPQEAVCEDLVPVGNAQGEAEALRLLEELREEEEALAVGQGPRFVNRLREFLDCGLLSPKVVAARVKKVLGALNGYTFLELIWRSYMCAAALHRLEALQQGGVPASVGAV